jgi:hypothetical protein
LIGGDIAIQSNRARIVVMAIATAVAFSPELAAPGANDDIVGERRRRVRIIAILRVYPKIFAVFFRVQAAVV